MDEGSVEPALEARRFRERYELQEVIATGGFARVYRARQRTTGQDVAVKVLSLRGGDFDREDLARFRRELAVCASLHHPNIVRLIDSDDRDEGSGRAIYAVFALIPGKTLAEVLAAEGALEPAEALHLMGQVLDALGCAHAAGVVHRDLKPSNVMVTATGARRNALVLDFGLGAFVERALAQDTSLTRSGDFVGTPGYAAPEQLRGAGARPSTDIFAWGLLLLECLTGRPVLEGPLAQIIHFQFGPKPIPIPESLDGHPLGRLIRSATDKNAERRAGRAADLLLQLERIASERLPRRDKLRDALAAESRETGAHSRAGLADRSLVPIHRNPNFTGRESLLSRIRAELQRVGGVVALRGVGGVGKSQLALEYAYRHRGAYELVAWLRAEKPETLADDYAAMAPTLGLREGAAPDQRARIEAVRSWLERHRAWLLVFDNAQSPDAIRRFLPRESHGHVLVTSRHPSWRAIGASVEVEELALDEAVDFLVQRTDERDRAAAEVLAEAVGRLPLALEEAAAYIEATGRSLRSYVQLFENQQRSLAPTTSLPGLEQSQRGTWELSFQQVEAEWPAAADLLRLFAFLAPDDIPLSLLSHGHEAMPAELAAALRDPIRFDACIAALRRFSLIKVQDEAASVHRMVQLATRSRLDASAHDEWAARAIRVAEASFPSGLAGDFYHPEARRLLPHALAALSHGGDLASEWLAAGRLQRHAGLYLLTLALQSEVVVYLERALAILEVGGAAAEHEIARTLGALGIVVFSLGDPERATALCERALELRERLLGPGDLRVASDHMSLAWELRALGRFEAVRDHARQAHEIAAAALGENHPLAAMPLAGLSRACWGLGDVEGARRAADRAIAVLERGEIHHPLVASGWHFLAQVEFDLGCTDVAARCLDTGIAIGERAWGEHEPTMIVSRVLRGMIELRRGRLEPARESLQRAIASGERVFQWPHEEIAIAHCLLARIHRRLGNPDAAAAALAEAKATVARVRAERTRSASHVELEYGLAALEAGDFTVAAKHAEEALRVLTGYPAPHPYQIPALDLLADALDQMGRCDEAREVARRASGIAEGAFGGEHPDLLATRRILEAP
jgi:serine/threonine protein kinase/tetratricopeptide (TPR) repeat protein